MTPEEEFRHYRGLAIALNEGPNGTNRLRAEALQRQLKARRAQQKGTGGAFLAGSVTSLVVILWGASFGGQLFVSGKLNPLIDAAKRIHQALQAEISAQAPAESAPTSATTGSRTILPIWQQSPGPDPATAMQGRFYSFAWGGAYGHLDAGVDNYRRLSGTLARMQAVGLRNRSAAHRLPMVMINRTNNCFSGSTIGAYSPRCEAIKIDYEDNQLAFEHPVEIEVTLAHEWGHHLINVSGEAMSPTEAEVVSDCTAGAAFGYYVKHGLINKDEAMTAFGLMAAVGNNSAHGHHPNADVRLRAFAGGLMSIAAPDEPNAQGAISFCSTLSRLLDLQKVRAMGLTWQA